MVWQSKSDTLGLMGKVSVAPAVAPLRSFVQVTYGG